MYVNHFQFWYVMFILSILMIAYILCINYEFELDMHVQVFVIYIVLNSYLLLSF